LLQELTAPASPTYLRNQTGECIEPFDIGDRSILDLGTIKDPHPNYVRIREGDNLLDDGRASRTTTAARTLN
jgi:hypothetical protein